MTLAPHNPPELFPRYRCYSHAIEVAAGSRLLVISGLNGFLADGVTMPESFEEQAEVIWQNIAAICAEAGMGLSDIVSITTYAVVGEQLGGVMAARDRALGGRRVASTLVTVPALVRPEWKMEISAVAVA